MHKSIPTAAHDLPWLFVSGGLGVGHEEYAYIIGVQAPDPDQARERFASLDINVGSSFSGDCNGTWAACGGYNNIQRIENTWMQYHPWHEGLPEVRDSGVVIFHLDDGRIFNCSQGELSEED